MAIGAQNKQQMSPAQFVGQANEGRLVNPGSYSNPNFNAQAFRPQETMSLVQEAMQNQTQLNNTQQQYYETRPWATLNNVLSAMDKSQPEIERMKLAEAVQTNAAMNRELQTINGLWERAYKGDMKAQEVLNNFTFSQEILEKVPVEKFNELKDALMRAQFSVTSSGMNAAMSRVKLGLKSMVENLVGENDPDAATLAGVISKAVSQSGVGPIQPEVLEEIQNRAKVYKLNNPKSGAINLGIVDSFQADLDSAKKQMLRERVLGDRDLTPRDASAVIGNLTKLIESDPAMDPMEKSYYKTVIQSLLVRSGLSGEESGFGAMPTPSGTTGIQTEPGTNPALDMLQRALNRLK